MIKRLITILCVLSLVFVTNVHSAGYLLEDGMVAYWKLDEASGNASDSTGNGYTLTDNGSGTYTAAKIHNGYNVATGNYLSSAAAGLAVGGGTAMTISAWVKPTSLDGYNTIIEKWNGTNAGYLFLDDLGGGKPVFYVQTANGLFHIDSTVVLSTGQWYLIVVVYDGSNLNLYINNAPAAVAVPTTGAITTSAGDFRMGLNSDDGGTLNGVIDEVGIWSRALSTTEIDQLYNLSQGKQYPFFFPCKGIINLFGSW